MAEIHEHDAMGCRACGREERASRGLSLRQLRHLHLPHLHLPRSDTVPGLRGAGSGPRAGESHAAVADRAVIARSAIAPLFAQPSLRAEQVSQLVLGETGRVEERAGEWRRIAATHDGYHGWVHAGISSRPTPRPRTAGAREAERLEPRRHAASRRAAACALPLRARVRWSGDRACGCPTAAAAELVEGDGAAGRRRSTPRPGRSRRSAGRWSISPARPTSGAA